MRSRYIFVSSSAPFSVLAGDAATPPIEVDLTYDSRTPYAVQMSFHTSMGTTTDWMLARDLLHDGLTGPVGLGDVRVQPLLPDRNYVQIELRSPSGHIRLATDAMRLQRFLERTYGAVPRDTEHYRLDIDIALAQLFNDPPRSLR